MTSELHPPAPPPLPLPIPLPTDPTNTSNSYSAPNITSSTAVFIIVLVSAFFFSSFLIIYMRHSKLFRFPSPTQVRALPNSGSERSSRNSGLEPALLGTLPTFIYSEVKGLKIGKETLECAICLSEFSDSEVLRLLPACDHVFHVDCIDIWLATHVTCPVCRSNLADRGADTVLENHHVAVDVDEAAGQGEASLPRTTSLKDEVSMLEDNGRYTLRLPEHVRGDIVAACNLRRASSTVAVPGRVLESGRRGFRVSQSDRWTPSLVARAMSINLRAWVGRRGEGDGSSRPGFPTFRASLGSFSNGGGGGGGSGRRVNSGGDYSERSKLSLARVRPSEDEV